MRILITNDDGIDARGLALLEQVAADLVRRHLGGRAERGAVGHRPFADPDPAGAPAATWRAALVGQRHADRRGDDGAGACHEGQPARPHPVGHQPRRQPGRGRDLFGHRLGGDGGRAGRRPLDRAQPGLCPQGLGASVPFAAAEGWAERVLGRTGRGADGHGHVGQRQFPGDRARGRSRASASAARGSATMAGCASSSAPTRAAFLIIGSASRRRSRRPATSPTSKSIADGYVTVTPLHLDLTHEGSLPGLTERFS